MYGRGTGETTAGGGLPLQNQTFRQVLYTSKTIKTIRPPPASNRTRIKTPNYTAKEEKNTSRCKGIKTRASKHKRSILDCVIRKQQQKKNAAVI